MASNNNNTASYAKLLNNVTNIIDLYYSAIIIPIGIFLNIVTVFIFARSSSVTKKNTIINLLYIGLSIYDILALINSILFAQLLPSLDIYIVNFSTGNCIGLNWWRKIVVQAPSWAQALITFERYLSVCYANKFAIFKSKRKVITMLISIFAILTIINMGQAWYYLSLSAQNNSYYVYNGDDNSRLVLSNSTNVCTSSNAVSLLTDIMNVLFRFLFPFTIMIILNYFISKNLFMSKKRSGVINRSFKQERNYTFTVVGFNVLFFVLNLPWTVYYILSHIQIAGVVVFSASLDVAILGLMNAVVFSIFYLNNLSSFFLNIFFNKVFRNQFFSMARGVWKLSTVPSSANVIPTQAITPNTTTKNARNETRRY